MEKILFLTEKRGDIIRAGAVISGMHALSEIKSCLVQVSKAPAESWVHRLIDGSQLHEPNYFISGEDKSDAMYVAGAMLQFEKICEKEKPDLITVIGAGYGETACCAFVARSLKMPVACIDAGIRHTIAHKKEDTNRVLIDHLADYLFAGNEDAAANLTKEGISDAEIYFVGNVLIDSIMRHLDSARYVSIIEHIGLKKESRVLPYALVLLERQENISSNERLKAFMYAVSKIESKLPVLIVSGIEGLECLNAIRTPVTEKSSSRFLFGLKTGEADNYNETVGALPIQVMERLRYIDYLCLLSYASLVLTDSSDAQEETTILGIPCLTLRDYTDRPTTAREGTNQLVGTHPVQIANTVFDMLAHGQTHHLVPKFWDGNAASRIISFFLIKNKEK